MPETTPTCFVCGASSEKIPLVTLAYQNGQIYICAQHLPILIHEPAKLGDKIPGLANLASHKHDH